MKSYIHRILGLSAGRNVRYNIIRQYETIGRVPDAVPSVSFSTMHPEDGGRLEMGKLKSCACCGTKERCHTFISRPAFGGGRTRDRNFERDMEKYINTMYYENEENVFCTKCAKIAFADYLKNNRHKLIFVVPNEYQRKSYNAYAFYPLDILYMAKEQDLYAAINSFMASQPSKCQNCEADAQFIIAGMDFFEGNDPFSNSLSEEITVYGSFCKTCFLEDHCNEIVLPDYIYPPLDISDGFMTPWEY